MVEIGERIIFGPLPPPYGGVSTFMSRLAADAADHGVRVWSYTGSLTPSGGAAEFFDHRRVEHIAALMRHGRGARITDSSHFHLEYPNPVLLPAWVAARSMLGFRWIKVLHDGSLPTRFAKFSATQRTLFHLAVRSIDEVVVVREELGRWLVNDADFCGEVHFIPALLPSAEDNDLSVSDELSGTLRQYKGRRRRICSVGAFIPSYGFHDVARAVEVLRSETGEDIGLLLADAGFARDDDYREQVLSGRPWIVVAEQVPQPEMRSVYQNSDVFVRAFEHESFGLSRIEALIAGIPVIATNVGETRGMLTYSYGDVDGICAHLRSLFSGEGLSDIEHWKAIFESEARENLRRYWQVIAPDRPAIDK